MKKIILLISFTSLLLSCSNNSNNNTSNTVNPSCQSQDFITKFNNIPNNASYNDVKAVFGSDGDNYSNSNTNNYKWYPCSDHNYYVDFWFQNNSLMILKNRTISDFSICSNNISITSFSSLTVGMTYNQVSSILNCQGDNFRIDNPTTANTKYYRFYNCNDTSKYIEAWFSGVNSTCLSISKNF
jgi:hypothetical protein